MDQQGIVRLPLTHRHLAQVESLPMHHGDPFDHLLIAQAICEDLTFVTRDREMAAYPVKLMSC
jgi:PIN domain nuclease of toxin-antitoxin system